MRHSDELDKIATAIAAVQRAVPFVEKSAKVDPAASGQRGFSWNYVPHEAVWEHLLETMVVADLAVSQGGREGTGGSQWLETLVVHTRSGQWIASEIRVDSAKAGMQGLGASWSYARRIGLLAAFGVVAKGEDTDAAGAGKGREAKPPRVDAAARPAEVTPDDRAKVEEALKGLTRATTKAQIDALAKHIGGITPKDMEARVRRAFSEARALVTVDAARGGGS